MESLIWHNPRFEVTTSPTEPAVWFSPDPDLGKLRGEITHLNELTDDAKAWNRIVSGRVPVEPAIRGVK